MMKVAIVGAGPGGMAACLALRAKGLEAQIYEQAPQAAQVGTGLTLFPNGLNCLDLIHPGMFEQLLAAGEVPRRVHVRRPDGGAVVSTPFQLYEHYGKPAINLHWASMQGCLSAALPAAAIQRDKRFHRFIQHPPSEGGGVTLQFEDGSEAQADVLVGADGVHSRVRAQLLDDGSPRYVGRMSWRAIFRMHLREPQAAGLKPGETLVVMSAEGLTFGLFDMGQETAEGRLLFWSVGAAGPSTVTPPEQLKSRILKTFEGWAEPIQAVLKATPDDVILERPLLDRPPSVSWSRGRVTLLGDAAHPMVPSLGQGANAAFEDALVLAHCLADVSARALTGTSDPWAQALQRYESLRLPRTGAIQARSAVQGARAYDQDAQAHLKTVLETLESNGLQFDDWLYRFPPPVLANPNA